MALPHPLVAVAAAAAVGGGSLIATLSGAHGVPERAAQAYIAAAHSAPCRLDYRIIAAIGAVESGHGTSGGAHIQDGDGKLTKDIVSSAGAVGVTQFMPKTWAAYGVDADGDGVADPNDVDDAAASTAAYLCANGAEGDIDGALWNYNHDSSYVAMVKERAAAMPPDDGSASGPAPGGQAPPPADKGRVCGVGEWLGSPGDCADSATNRASYLWASLGDTLDGDDTKRLHAVWAELNGKPPAAPAPVAQPGPGPGLNKDLPDLPGSEGLQPDFASNLAALVKYAPGTISINQGYRSPEDALGKWEAALDKYGSEDEARQWVAKTVEVNGVIQCGSNHCKGLAADLSFADGEVEAWAHNHAADYGLTFPLSNESWHIEPSGIRP